jgi:parallel beta-helix repeat protein
VISGHTSIGGSGQDGILAMKLSGHTVQIAGASIDHAGAFGINLSEADHLTLTNNTVTNSAATYPAIYLNGFTGLFGNVFGNKGAGNGLDAMAFHGTITDGLQWQTARKTADPTQLLGYVLDNTLNMQSGQTLTVNAGDIVKVGNGGTLNLAGVALRADDTTSSAQKIFTSLTDNSAGVVACPSVLLPGCVPAAAGDWAGISLSGSAANGTVVNASVRYAATGVSITNGASSTFGSSSFGLVVSRSTVSSTKTDGVFSTNTALSVTDSTISGGVHGANVTLTNAPATQAAVRLSGNRFMSQGSEAILGQGLFGQPVWITDNRVQNAGTFGIRLLNSNEIVLRNNNVVGSGGGPTAGAGRYPAIYMPNVSADFTRNVRGNLGSGNGLDAIAFDGTVTSNLTWVTPGTNTSTKPLGYLLDGGVTLDGTTLTVNPDDVVKALGGPITINGGSLLTAGTVGHIATFTSLKDNASGAVAKAVSCPSVFVSLSDCGQPQAGNWGGIVITDKAGQRGDNTIDHSQIEYAITGISIDSGPITTLLPQLNVTNSKILHTSLEGINASDTPIDIEASIIGDQATAPGAPADIRAHGIIASFFSPASCPSLPGCKRLTLIGNQIYSTGKDGIVANGLGGQPTVVKDNIVTDSGTYGIRLVGADQLTVTTNHVRKSAPLAGAALRYPAIYLSSVKADFETIGGTGAIVQGNDGRWTGMDAVVFHGEATKKLTWITAAAAPLPPLPVADVAFGYLLDGALTVDGDFVTSGDIVKTLNGGIKINGGSLQSNGTLFTSLKDSAGMTACQSVFIPACPSTPAAGDWNGINIDATDSVFSNGTLLYASSGVTINSAALKLNKTLITGLTGYAVTTTGTGSTQLDCASIHGNGGGILSQGASNKTTATYSDLYGNTLGDLKSDAPTAVATTATNDWWGKTPPDAGQYSASVIVNTPLPQQAPTFKLGAGAIAFSSDNTNSSSGNDGKGTLTVTLTADREVDGTVPLSVSLLGPAETVPHPVTGSWKGDNLTWQGTAAIDPLSNIAGLNTLTITGAKSCVPDGNKVMAPETGSFTIDLGKATVTGPAIPQNVGARSATFTDSVNPNGWSNPSTNPRTDTYVFFQYRLDSGGVYDAGVIAGLQAGTVNPTGLLGYQMIGHGTSAIPVKAQVSQLLAPSTIYDYRVVAVDLNGIVTGLDHQFTTLAAADHFSVAGAATTKAGDPYAITVTALNPANKTVIDYPGTVAFSTSDPQWIAPSPGTLTNGTGTFSATLKTAGSQSITAGDGLISGQLTPITVNAAAAASLTLGAPATATAGTAFSVTVAAKDLYGNVATGYAGTVSFSGGGAGATLPSAYSFVPGDNGMHTFTNGATLQSAGSQTISATDGTLSNAATVTVSAGAATSLTLSAPATATAGTAFSVTVTAKDLYGNVATAYAGTVTFSGGGAGATLPGAYPFVPGDNGMHTFTNGVTLLATGSQTILVTDGTLNNSATVIVS